MNIYSDILEINKKFYERRAKIMKKLILIFSIILLAFSFVGCNVTTDAPSSSTQSEDKQTSSTQSEDKQTSSAPSQSEDVSTVQTKCGYIFNINIDEKNLDVDEIDWITLEDTEKIEALGLDVEHGFPNGYYRHNPDSELVNYKITEDTAFERLDWENGFTPKKVDYEEFATLHNEQYDKYIKPMVEEREDFDYFVPYWIEVKGDIVISIKEQFVP